ncbi:uncharacterized protein LOC107048644 [Diachasma alloeum]|uniref:uncharacterized protein LOC107048644 n=1 Tax=Diachasma alloeum TaxID=454923 RepID=UPI0007381D7D|nr:uncharacterized protein LOC107048644 [Diachasma alloeum]
MPNESDPLPKQKRAASSKSPRKKTRKSYSFREKAAMIAALATKPLTAVARKNGINEKLLYKWRRNHNLILEAAASEVLSQKKKNKPVNEELEEHLYNWFLKAQSAGIPVSGPIVRAVALDLNKQLGGKETFKASHGWLDRWKKHKNIRFPRERSSPGTCAAEPSEYESPAMMEEENFIKTEEMSPPDSPKSDADDHKDFVTNFVTNWAPNPPETAAAAENSGTESRMNEEAVSNFDDNLVKNEKVSPPGSPCSDAGDDRDFATAWLPIHEERSPGSSNSDPDDLEEFSKKSRKSYSFQEKADIIRLLKTTPVSDVSRESGVHYRLLYKWMRNEEVILEAARREDMSGRKQKGHRNEELEDHVYKWFKAAQSAGIQVTGPIIKAVALDLNRQLGGKETFKASCGWLDKWKKLKKVVLPRLPGKSSSDAPAEGSLEGESPEVIRTEDSIKTEDVSEDGSLPSSSNIDADEHRGFVTEWLPMSEEVPPPGSPDSDGNNQRVVLNRKSYSFAEKAKVLKALETESHKAVAERFCISEKSLYRWKRDRVMILEAAARDGTMKKSRNRLGKYRSCAKSLIVGVDPERELGDGDSKASEASSGCLDH